MTTAEKDWRRELAWPKPPNAPVTEEQKQRFLDALRSGASVTEAAQAAPFDRATAYKLRKHDEVFAREWFDTIEEGTETLERECARRAMDGSDLLMIFLLKARRPEVYRDRYEVHHTTGEPLTAGDLEAIRDAGRRPELAAHLDALADALAEQQQAGRRVIEPAPTDVAAAPPPDSPGAAAGGGGTPGGEGGPRA